ncbi:maleylpyruvate isomerase family mycothiol-dependent enzyme [Isoptericola sp. S6320L]|uniref:maleylpyruvate isomerase family mycothiol-dependent enzyme n=1 Tax=Isoptericola sp. S6320L TaxID=2926411 RepID=UPI001FF34C45|nr:maleylpyruvate isomerase family mycothiol-dependent enzyme [Isoptericola sp. S6320L]MCK0117498.1 maleylpyruvate isomerase family mycothiol-dependent enzyme [Isoptericola sp. S6320L]
MTTPAPAVDPSSGRRTDGAADLDRLALLARLQEAFAADVDGADPAAPVPACGRWRVRNLVTHLGRIHHWAAGQARRVQETPLGRGPFDLAPFYAEQAAEVRDTLAALGPDATSWTLLGNGPASFWRRRQAHETLVHLHDLRAARLGSATAVGREEPVDVPAPVWADAVDEVVHLFAPRQVRLGRMDPLTAAVGLEATDLGWSWTLGDGDPAVVARGPSRELALVLWRRLTPSEAEVEVLGDAATLHTTLAAPIVP